MADPSAVSVVIPALDEAATIGEIVARLRAAASWREVLVVDDGSRGRIPNGAVVLFLFAALVFLVGLVSEQVASRRVGHGPDR